MRVRRNAGGSMRLLAVLTIAVLFAASCGGDDEDTTSNGASPEPTTDTSESTDDEPADSAEDEAVEATESDDDTGDDAAPADAPAAGSATVTIGDETFVADQEVICFAVADAVSSSWTDGGEISFDFDLPPLDWEDSPDDWTAPAIRVDDDNDPQRQFRADPEFVSTLNIPNPELSAVTSYTVDGSTASGTAMFVEINNAMVSQETVAVEGTFSFSCS